MEYADIYYVDPRNAVVHDHRTSAGNAQLAGRVPLRPSAMISAQPTAMMAQPAGAYPYPPAYPQPLTQYPQYPQYVMTPPLLGGNLGSIVHGLGGLGQLVDIAAQIFAAVMPLPTAPNPVGGDDGGSMSDANTNSKNLITYQSALASYAKRDEQIRTIGSLVKKLVG